MMNTLEKTNNSKNQTPIEVALEIDKNGMTTAKKLYGFLELDIRNYSRWCKKNIEENIFATENVDFTRSSLMTNGNPNPTTDYKLTANFAKKLCMTSKTERGEQARNYFIKVEEALKNVAAQKLYIPSVQPYKYKSWPVYSAAQISDIYGCSRTTITKKCKYLEPEIDYKNLIGVPLKGFKEENTNLNKNVAYMLVVFESGMEKLDKMLSSIGYDKSYGLTTSQSSQIQDLQAENAELRSRLEHVADVSLKGSRVLMDLSKNFYNQALRQYEYLGIEVE